MPKKTRTENKIAVHYGMPDYFKWYCKNYKPLVSRGKYSDIISEFNEGIIELMLNKNIDYTPIMLQMTFSIRKNRNVPTIKNGKLSNVMPVDFKATNELWESNPEAKENKILVRHINRHTDRYVFKIKLLKTGYNYLNKKYYAFKPSRNFQRSLAHRIFDEDKQSFDTYNLY